MLPQEGDCVLNLLCGSILGVGEDDTACVLHLVAKKLAEILHIHLALACVHHGGKAAQHGPLGGGSLHGSNDVGELTYARGLDENTVGGVLGQDLGQRLAEITHQGAADATRVHLVDLNACLGQKTAVDADLAKLVLNEYQLLACVCLGNELFDQSGFTGAQKAGENVDLCHGNSLLYLYSKID